MTKIVDYTSPIEDIIEILQAALDGESIEYRTGIDGSWRTPSTPKMLYWDFKNVSYRIKPKEPLEFYVRICVNPNNGYITFEDVQHNNCHLADRVKATTVFKVREIIE